MSTTTTPTNASPTKTTTPAPPPPPPSQPVPAPAPSHAGAGLSRASTATATADPDTAVANYYAGLQLAPAFEDLDDSAAYDRVEAAIRDGSAHNFVVDFGGAVELPEGGRARCALDVAGPAGVAELLLKPRPREIRTRWINVFGPHRQKALVETILRNYGFSLRLMNVITTPPSADTTATTTTTTTAAATSAVRVEDTAAAAAAVARDAGRHGLGVLRKKFSRRGSDEGPDVERGANGHAPDGELEAGAGSAAAVPLVPLAKKGAGEHMNYMTLVRKVWHWHAVEYGGRYICIGMNNLHNVRGTHADSPLGAAREDARARSGGPAGGDEAELDFDDGQYDPVGRRLWSWLILCDDGTVVSLYEDIEPTDDVVTIRRNLLNVFRSLSQSDSAIQADKRDPDVVLGGGLDDLPFRRLLPHQAGENVEGGPSLLLYYLFDDWQSSYSFVLGRGYPYSMQMRQLRLRMSSHPELAHLSTLNKLARQLDTLKRMYETKRIILDNILYRHENSLSHQRKPGGGGGGAPVHRTTTAHTTSSFVAPSGDPDVLGVPLNALAAAKFERLRDRIKLYALGELASLLGEKAELENMIFNLLTLRENATVEKLTRITIWLTKAAFMFMPLTLVTGYFSMQLRGVEDAYGPQAFWGAAGVTVALSLVVLYTVGKSTGTSDLVAMRDAVVDVWAFWRLRGERAREGGGRAREGGGRARGGRESK